MGTTSANDRADYRAEVIDRIANETGIKITDPQETLDLFWHENSQAVLAAARPDERSCLLHVTERTEQTVTLDISCTGHAGKPRK